MQKLSAVFTSSALGKNMFSTNVKRFFQEERVTGDGCKTWPSNQSLHGTFETILIEAGHSD